MISARTRDLRSLKYKGQQAPSLCDPHVTVFQTPFDSLVGLSVLGRARYNQDPLFCEQGTSYGLGLTAHPARFENL